MHILLVTAKLPPTKCGVGDHTAMLAKRFVSAGHQVSILTGQGTNADSIKGVAIRKDVPNWGTMYWRHIAGAIDKANPDAILINWVPQLYTPKGVSLGLALAARHLAKRGHKVYTMLHELWIPSHTIKRFLASAIQQSAVKWLVEASVHVGVSTRAWMPLLQKRFAKHSSKFGFLSVGSNIGINQQPADAQKLRDSLGIQSADKIVLVFSPHGSGKMPELIENVWEAVGGKKGIHLVVVGQVEPMFRDVLMSSVHGKKVHLLGYLADSKVSDWLSSADVLLAPFTDGASTRRGSVLAAISHGLPVVTTRGHLADEESLAEPAVRFADQESNEVVIALEKMLEREKNVDDVKRVYDSLEMPWNYWERVFSATS